jgi:hypothetical protein
MPNAAKTGPGLKYLNGHAHGSQTVQEIEAGKSRANHDYIEIFDLTVASPFHFNRTHMFHSLFHSLEDSRAIAGRTISHEQS